MPDPSYLPYRLNVGIVLFGPPGCVFVGERKNVPGAWQLPQGGIDDGEDPRHAAWRELAEETGTDRAELIGEHPDWLVYDLPPHLLGVAWDGKFRGQRQKWFAFRFTGLDADIRLDADPHPEFSAWRWVELAALPALAVPFKRHIYQILARDFAAHAQNPSP